MSPVAAEAASPWSTLGPVATGAVVPVCALVIEGGGAAFFEDPQPAASATTNTSSTAAVLVLSACPVSAGRFTGIRRPSVPGLCREAPAATDHRQTTSAAAASAQLTLRLRPASASRPGCSV